ncbi:MAG: sterol desaturase family protein [Bacteroidetes bacterium]|nr:sterol desaturase family protein [Bacteroidota bacterium]
MKETFWQVMLSVGGRYFVFAGLAYLVFYVGKNRRWLHLKIQPKDPKKKVVREEFLYSLLTIVIFSVVIWWLVFSPFKVHTRVYDKVDQYGMAWFWASIFVCIVMHDTYFYWTHRLMHWKAVFRFAHHIHHKSHNPTPLASYAFHPVEALVEVGIVPVIVFTIPVHGYAFAIFGLYMIIMNVIGHLGFEVFTRRFMESRWLKYFLNSSTHHNMHHKYSKCNYGLYFNFWDRIMGTNHPAYEDTYKAVFEKAPAERKLETDRMGELHIRFRAEKTQSQA